MIQYFDHASIFGHKHILSAVFHALRAEESGRSRTRDLSVDIARFVAGERQIHHAFVKVGLKKSTKHIVAAIIFPMNVMEGKEEIQQGLDDLFKNLGLVEGPAIQTDPELLADALERMSLVELKL